MNKTRNMSNKQNMLQNKTLELNKTKNKLCITESVNKIG